MRQLAAWTRDGLRILARVKRDVRTKLGLAFVRGEYVIATESPAVIASNGAEALGPRVTAWSHRNACDTSLNTSDVEWI